MIQLLYCILLILSTTAGAMQHPDDHPVVQKENEVRRKRKISSLQSGNTTNIHYQTASCFLGIPEEQLKHLSATRCANDKPKVYEDVQEPVEEKSYVKKQKISYDATAILNFVERCQKQVEVANENPEKYHNEASGYKDHAVCSTDKIGHDASALFLGITIDELQELNNKRESRMGISMEGSRN